MQAIINERHFQVCKGSENIPITYLFWEKYLRMFSNQENNFKEELKEKKSWYEHTSGERWNQWT